MIRMSDDICMACLGLSSFPSSGVFSIDFILSFLPLADRAGPAQSIIAFASMDGRDGASWICPFSLVRVCSLAYSDNIGSVFSCNSAIGLRSYSLFSHPVYSFEHMYPMEWLPRRRLMFLYLTRSFSWLGARSWMSCGFFFSRTNGMTSIEIFLMGLN